MCRCTARGVSIGKNVWISSNVVLETEYPKLITIDEGAFIGIGVIVIAHFRESRRGVRIGKQAFIGPGVIILPNVDIGEGAVVTAGSVVTSSIPVMTLVQENPAVPVAKCGVRYCQTPPLQSSPYVLNRWLLAYRVRRDCLRRGSTRSLKGASVRLIVPYVKQMREMDARMVRLAEFLGIPCETLALVNVPGPVEFLEKAVLDQSCCFFVNPQVMKEWVGEMAFKPILLPSSCYVFRTCSCMDCAWKLLTLR